MARYRSNFIRRSQYWLPRNTYRTVRDYCECYYELKEEYRNHVGLSRGDTGAGASGEGDPTAMQAIQLANVGTHIRRIEDIARSVAPELHPYLLMGVAEGATYSMLEGRGIPCGRGLYYRKRQEVYYRIACQLGLKITV